MGNLRDLEALQLALTALLEAVNLELERKP